jgi:hypothetical protein
LIRPEDILLSKRITWRIDEPFTIFEGSNFFAPHVYAELCRTFPDRALDDVLRRSGGRQARMTLGSDELAGILRGEPVWADLVDALISREFAIDIFACLGDEIRSTFRKRAGMSRLQPLYGSVLTWPGVTVRDLDVNYSTRGYELTPHVDSPKKLLALLFYFPEEPAHEGAAAGTGFWRRRPGSPDLPPVIAAKGQLPRRVAAGDDAERARRVMDLFEASYERFHVAEYRANQMSGFVKTNDSWHDVDLRGFPEGARRRVVLYNINLR